MSRKHLYSYDEVDELYDTIDQEFNRKRDRKKRNNYLAKERRYKFSRRNHIQRNQYAY